MYTTYSIGLAFILLLRIHVAFSVNGGSAATLNDFPFQVAINLPNNTFCGGTIVHRNHVLTAASCVVNVHMHLVSANTVRVRPYIVNLANTTVQHQGVAIFVHPRFNPVTRENDVAVIRINANFSSTDVARLQRRIVADGTDCRISGWYITAATPNPSLRFMTVRIRNRDTVCNAPTSHNGAMLNSMVCANSSVPNAGSVCLTTRGGGLYCNQYLTGILSFGLDCNAPPRRPGVYTQVRMDVNWIERQYNNTNIPTAGPIHPNATTEGSSASTMCVSMIFVMVSIFVSIC